MTRGEPPPKSIFHSKIETQQMVDQKLSEESKEKDQTCEE